MRIFKYILFLLPALSFGQKVSIKGTVFHFKNAVSNATVVLNDRLSQPTGKDGAFLFSDLEKGIYQLRISHVEYETLFITLNLQSDTLLSPIHLEDKANELKEVVVSGNKEEKIRRENQLNITVANQAFLQRNLSGSLMQTLEKLPGVNAMTIGSGQSKPQIRGLGFNQVVVLDGGLKHEGQQWGADHGLEIDQFASGNVEILKGSASYLYGSDAIGGIIKVNPPNIPALHTMGLSLNSSYMSNSNSIANSLNFFARVHKWYFDARATIREYGDYKVPAERIFVYDYEVKLPDGHIRNSAGKERNFHFYTGRITEKLQTRLSFSNVFSESGFFANAHGLEPRLVNTELHDASHRDIQLPNQNVNHFKIISNNTLSLNRHDVTLDLAYQNNHREEHSQYVGHGFMPAVYPSEINIPETLERLYNKNVFSVNLRDEFSINKHQITYGGNYEHQANEISGWGFLIPAYTQNQAGIFVYDKYKFSEKTLLHAALRYDWAKIDIKEYTDWFMSENTNGEKVNLQRVQNISRKFDNLNWSVGANHTLGQFDFKLNIGTSFRVPLAKELAASGVNYHYFRYEKGNATLSPEKSYQIDFGVFWKTEKLQIELTPFYNYFPNYIYLNPTSRHDYFYGAGNQVFEYEQSKVLRYGAETQIKWTFLPYWNTSLAGEYLYNRQLSGSKKGYNLPFTPPPSALWSLSYEPKFWQDSYITLEIKHALEQARIVPPEKVTPAYTLLGLMAGGAFKVNNQKWNLSLQANNLLNQKYLNHTSFYRLIDLPEMARNIIVTLKIPVVFAI